MSLRSFGANYSYCYHCYHSLSSHISLARRFSASQLRISARAMSYRPNFQGGRRGGGPNSRGRGGARRGGGGGGGGRGGGRGEQRWWDPVWRAERLRQQQAEVYKPF